MKAHVGRLMRKTGAENRIELSIKATEPALGRIQSPTIRHVGKGSGRED